jgi:hypothetical protein
MRACYLRDITVSLTRITTLTMLATNAPHANETMFATDSGLGPSVV